MTIGVNVEDEVECKADGCQQRFGTTRSMHDHHTKLHGESIARNDVECEVCGETFQEESWEDRSYCSPECVSESLRRREETTCAYCGTTFEHRPSENRKYCGRRCSGKDNSYSG